MSFMLQDNQKAALAVAFVDEAGNPGLVDGVPSWASSDPSLLDVVAAPDGLSAVMTAVGPLGVAQVQVMADADLGTGITQIGGILDVEIVASEAVSATVTPGTPEHR